MQVLFVCSQHRLRSRTAETISTARTAIRCDLSAPRKVRAFESPPVHLGWADLIFVMEKRHLNRLPKKYRDELARWGALPPRLLR